LRANHPTFRRKRFFTGNTVRTGDGERLNDIVWLHADGRPMEGGDWEAGDAKVIGMYLNGHGIAGTDTVGDPIVDDHFLLYFNAGHEPVDVTLPPEEYSDAWMFVVDTAAASRDAEAKAQGSTLVLEPRSVLVLQEYDEPEDEQDVSVAASLIAMAEPAQTSSKRRRSRS
jgi:glycogen operon protein